MNADKRLPNAGVQLNREHRLYQADWLMRFYKFDATELIDEAHPFLDPELDPKANWALSNLDIFPVEVNTTNLETLLRVPGIGPRVPETSSVHGAALVYANQSCANSASPSSEPVTS